MPTTYLPTRESDLLAFSQNMADVLAPDPTLFGLTMEQVGAYQQIQGDFATAYTTANQPQTRSPTNIEIKNIAKQALIAMIREYVKIIQAYPGTTNAMRSALEITIPDNIPTPVPVPTIAPKVTVMSVEGRLFNLELREIGSERRGKPTGVKCAWLYTYVGEDLPTFEQMTFRGSTGKTDTKIVFPESVPVGSKVWISACWVNPAEKPGPVSLPIFSSTNYGSMQNNAA